MPPEPLSRAAWLRYEAFLRAPPELALEWEDPESEARAWLVLNSLRGGAAGGGTRMRSGLGREEVTFLAKVMELKFAVAGPPIGGAKTGIDFDPADPRKVDVLRRWFRAIRPFLESRYATAGDLNVDELREVAPCAREAGLLHHQEGVARGHYGLQGEELRRRLAVLREGLGRRLAAEDAVAGWRPTVADVVTGFGVAAATRRMAERRGTELRDTRVLLEGFGRVGSAAAVFLSRWGARVVGILDLEGLRVSDSGFSSGEILGLLERRKDRRNGDPLPPERLAEARARFGEIPADVCVCAAASGTLDSAVLERFSAQGVEAIVCGANRPFAAAEPGDTALEREADRRFIVVADFVANCGTAHAFAFQMDRSEPAPPSEILASVRRTVERHVDAAADRAGSRDRGWLGGAIATVLEELGPVSDREEGPPRERDRPDVPSETAPRR